MRVPKAPRVSEKIVQRHIVQALRTVGATVYVLGTTRPTGDHPGTCQTPGVGDVLAFLPPSPKDGFGQQLWVEVKATGGRLSEAQKGFRDCCHLAGVPHLVGGLDVVLAYLQAKGYIREAAALYRRPA